MAEVDFSPLRRRAWVLQGVSLAPRVLNFGKTQMWWECFEFEACETYPNGIPDALMLNSYSLRPRYSDSDTYVRYEELVETYSACALTFDTDRVIACAGIAQHCQRSLQDRYIAGMFQSVIVRQLLWRVNESSLPRAYRPLKWRAPSWSWLSIEGPVDFDWAPLQAKEAGEVKMLSRVVEVDVRLRDPANPFGFLLAGMIELAGPIKDLHFRPDVSACESIVIEDDDDDQPVASITIPEDELGNVKPLEFGWDESHVDSTEDRWRFIAMTKFRQDGIDMLYGLLLRPCSAEEDSPAYERVGQLQVRGIELVKLFLSHREQQVCVR